jgi:aldehyde:ferredoxin oxidoreductase
MARGYWGKILRVNLDGELLTDEHLDEGLIEKFVGGSGIASRMLFDEVPPDASALGPQNRLIFMTGPFAGTTVPAGSRYEAVFKSPQTSGYGEANAGGYWGAELKRTGYDGIVIEGSARSPTILVITDEGAYLKDAGRLWGKDTLKTEQMLSKELGGTFRFVSIGPAGENLATYSALINDGGRAAARTGSGAVMGSKRLKAIAVHGEKSPGVADMARIKELNKGFLKRIKENKASQRQSALGTAGGFPQKVENLGYGLVKNWQVDLSEWPGKAAISGALLNEKYVIRKETCYRCPIGCGRLVRHPKDGTLIRGPEYESIALLGAQLCLSDMEGLILANHLCNTLGLDVISTGGSIAFAMECFERGLIPEDILQGQQVPWGDRETILTLIQDIAYKRGRLGEMLSYGVRHASDVLGNDTADFAPHVKGVEFPAHDPRSCQSWALGFATNSTGARHTESITYADFNAQPQPHIGLEPMDCRTVEGKPRAVKRMQEYLAVLGSCVGCNFVYGTTDSIDYIRGYLEAVTGHKRSLEELLRCGERSFNVKRSFNVRHGMGRREDALPGRFTRDALKAGSSKGFVARSDEMLEEYYQLRGWDSETGWPRKQKLEELSLTEVGEALYGPDAT